jgi:hypothetical protein
VCQLFVLKGGDSGSQTPGHTGPPPTQSKPRPSGPPPDIWNSGVRLPIEAAALGAGFGPADTQ